MTNHAPERSRPYFEHEIQFCCRVIFDWRVSKRWPNSPEFGRWGTRDHEIEGVEFRSEQAAAAFDLEQVRKGGWELFDTWEEAEKWVMYPG